MQTIRHHIQQRIAQAELHIDPFLHFEIDDFWPQDIYQQMLEHNLFKTSDIKAQPWLAKYSNTNPNYALRTQIMLSACQPGPANEDFWIMIKQVLLEDCWYVTQIANRAQQFFSHMYGPNFADGSYHQFLVPQLFLQQHQENYFIGPHTDKHDRVVTNIWNLASDHDHYHLGTSLYRAQDPHLWCPGGRHYDFDKFVKVKQIKYRPNSLFVFFKTRFCFHAVDQFDTVDDNHRFGMQLQVYETKIAPIGDDPNYQRLLG